MSENETPDSELTPGQQYDNWYAPMVLVDRLTQAEVCLKHLEKYTDGQYVGHPPTFDWFTFSSCLMATTEIAAQVANDGDASTLYRRDAMESLLLLAPGSVYAQDKIDPAVLTELIDADDDDDMSTWHLLSIVKTLAVHGYPHEFKVTSNEVNTVFRKFGTELEIEIPEDSSGMIQVLPAFQLLRDELQRRMTTIPEADDEGTS